MANQDFSEQYKRPSVASFNRLLADYRACVYEHYFFAINSPIIAREKSPKQSILVIDDNTDQWFLTRWALLQRFPKAQIHWLKEDCEVIPYLDDCRQREEELPRMVLVDLYLPSAQQGLHVLQTLKSHSIYKQLPAVTLSWSNHVEDIAQSFDCLADGYLVKPARYQDWMDGIGLLDRYLK